MPIPPLDIELPPLNPGSISAAFSKEKAAAASASSIEDQLAANMSHPSSSRKPFIQEEIDPESPDRTPVNPAKPLKPVLRHVDDLSDIQDERSISKSLLLATGNGSSAPRGSSVFTSPAEQFCDFDTIGKMKFHTTSSHIQ
ncbi:hypothetical protein Hypma_003009 [Hypsizygus marmoreus]|uniref:Uncharacterized protein n=1 Tax=Hypsizygus marmoreus TaxID=39966 RepID=A0A369J528_HYPMA|nr:hypothetical protein Hypma_003009 [Hypsizygus marmoreus]